MSAAKEKFATQVTSDILAELRALAQAEGRQLQALVDEAEWVKGGKDDASYVRLVIRLDKETE